MTPEKTQEQALRLYFAELKRSDPLQDVPKPGRAATATLRLIEELLWIAHPMPATLYPALGEDDQLRCLKLALGKAAYSFEVLCIAYRIDPAGLHVRSKRPRQVASTSRPERLAELQEQLLDQCWSHGLSPVFCRERRGEVMDTTGVYDFSREVKVLAWRPQGNSCQPSLDELACAWPACDLTPWYVACDPGDSSCLRERSGAGRTAVRVVAAPGLTQGRPSERSAWRWSMRWRGCRPHSSPAAVPGRPAGRRNSRFGAVRRGLSERVAEVPALAGYADTREG